MTNDPKCLTQASIKFEYTEGFPTLISGASETDGIKLGMLLGGRIGKDGVDVGMPVGKSDIDGLGVGISLGTMLNEGL